MLALIHLVAHIHQNHFPTIAKVNGTGKSSNPGPNHSVQDILPATTAQLKSQRYVRERKGFSFALDSGVCSCELWKCCSHFAASSFISSFPICMLSNSFSCATAVKVYSNILSMNEESRYSCLLPDLKMGVPVLHH